VAKRKKSSSPEYSINHAELTGYSASIDASISHKVRESRYYEDDAKVYDFGSHLELEGHFIYSEDRAEEKILLNIYGSDSGHSDFELTLADCQSVTIMDRLNTAKLEARKFLFTMFLRVSDISNAKEGQGLGGVVYGLNNEQLQIC